MRKIFKFIVLVICFIGIFSIYAYAQSNSLPYETFKVMDNDKYIDFPENEMPIKYKRENYDTYSFLIPLRSISEYFGATFEYDEKTGNAKVINKKDDITVVFLPDEKTAIRDGIEYTFMEDMRYIRKINGIVYIEHDKLDSIFYRKSFKWGDNLDVILYDRPIYPVKTYYNDKELIFEEGQGPYYDDENFSSNITCLPIKKMSEYLGFTVYQDKGKRTLEINSEKGSIKIQFKRQFTSPFGTITYDAPDVFLNGERYNLWSSIIEKDGILYATRRDLRFMLEDLIGKENYYDIEVNSEGDLTEYWYSEDYLKLKQQQIAEGKSFDKFSDVKPSHWFYDHMTKLVEKGLIGGYPDKTFRPNAKIRVSEFTKILITSLGYEISPANGEHWATNYIRKAEELGLIRKGEFINYDMYITRGEMAKMIVRAGESIDNKGNDLDIPDNYEEYASLITDYSIIDPASREYALKIFASGIISGFPDGTFGFYENATRAETCTILIRFLEEEQRKAPVLH